MTARLVRLLEMRGHDAAALCRSANVSVEEVVHPSARIPYRVADALLEACAEVLGAGDLSIALAGVFDRQTYDAAGLVLISSSTFGEGLERALAYQRLWGDGERFTLRRDARGGVLRFRHPGPSVVAGAVLAELALLETISAARALVDPAARAVAARLAHAPLAPPAALAKMFGVEPTFRAAENELVLDRTLLDAPIRVSNEALRQALEMLAQQALEKLPPSATLAVRVRAICTDDPKGLSLRVAEVARRLHMSARTLQRRLRAEGTSLDDLIDDMRRERANELARCGATEKEITFLIGFADPSALTRARARWSSPKKDD